MYMWLITESYPASKGQVNITIRLKINLNVISIQGTRKPPT